METAAPKRQRTESQLARKRQADRISQKARREQTKRHMDHLEAQLTRLQHSVESLSDQMQTMNRELRQRHTCCSCHGGVPLSTNMQAISSFQNDQNINDNSTLAIREKTSPPASWNRFSQAQNPFSLIDCRCGVGHRLQSECLEYSTFAILLKTHENIAEGKQVPIMEWLPRTPPLVSIFRPSASTNPVIRILGGFFRQVHPNRVSTLLACCLLMYRYLRWRLYPDEETSQDVPKWVHPTETQKTIPHPVCIDFLPWPGLRDYIVKHQNTDPRHSASRFIRSIRLRWPESRQCYTMSAQGELLLYPEFEAAVYQYGNWQLSRECVDMFPYLREFVNVEDDIR